LAILGYNHQKDFQEVEYKWAKETEEPVGAKSGEALMANIVPAKRKRKRLLYKPQAD